MVVDLTRMKSGATGKVVRLEGGEGLIVRLENLGLRPGKRITKVSAHFWRGPVTVQVGGVNVALGFGMAQRVMVELDEQKR